MIGWFRGRAPPRTPGPWIVRLDAILFKISFEGCRRHERVGLTLPGRYMLRNAREYSCSTIDVSANGLAVRTAERCEIGEHVIAYIGQLGRVEGAIVRQLDDGFAVALRVSTSQSEKLAARVGWIVEHQIFGASDNRRHDRMALADARATLRTAQGDQYPATLVDISREGALIQVAAAPPIGATVNIGRTRAHVVRHFAGGVAVSFDANDPPIATLGREVRQMRQLASTSVRDRVA
jgi:hypothetical protein